ncbi:pyridoxal kinase [Pogonomyrmex barbatus]|uniref:Pyridoxal kinase n=1 Tax=Pogonomyrmex barbatus TaxID=144034 RepID=A0A6I9VY31_9HYME|nr:pyridoxal kinase [Pogonomyrmex barbatus]XP_011634150.1 pyridoxal kinase [Pogonomyrmex barbatus]XP_011634151.1 pyridoxal kinase [Pogonomyrmex barbatus]XP_025073581.1 pyridoxal kinase [Pogonomyrmex barbatus]
MNSTKTPRILSIQSHVVSGYVGNKSATFPLQLLGFEVDAINSVQLSNHTGYKMFKGQVLNDKDLEDLVDGLAQNGLDNYTHLLTGYIGSASFLKRVVLLITTLKAKNPNLTYVCDPVMGDDGKMYVPQALKEIYKKEIIPLADVVTPNQFEIELLTDEKITNMNELQNAIKKLHQAGPKIVAISSTELNDKLTTVVSTAKDATLMKIDIPRIPVTFTGSGDLFAALFLAHIYLQNDMKTTMEKTINSLYSVLLNTYEYSKVHTDAKIQPARKIELRLVQSKNNIENPEIRLFAESLYI